MDDPFGIAQRFFDSQSCLQSAEGQFQKRDGKLFPQVIVGYACGDDPGGFLFRSDFWKFAARFRGTLDGQDTPSRVSQAAPVLFRMSVCSVI